MPATTADTLSLVTRTVTVAPLVLLSVADHYGRSAKGTRKRVVGVLLGDNSGQNVRVSNSFAGAFRFWPLVLCSCLTHHNMFLLTSPSSVPFEEDEKDPSVWFLDHNFVESMRDMFKKINAREKLIGWYHSGPKLRASDLEINELFKRYTPNPLLVIVDVQPKEVGVPTDAYFAVDEIKDVSGFGHYIENDLSLEKHLLIRMISFLGWYHNLQDLRTYSFHNRSRRS
jgi:26S proteasome regulatory subunit N8